VSAIRVVAHARHIRAERSLPIMNLKALLLVVVASLMACHGAIAGEPSKRTKKGASAKLVYEDAKDEDVAKYFAAGQPKITCVAADTKSGCK
jgi:hypothetical protein